MSAHRFHHSSVIRYSCSLVKNRKAKLFSIHLVYINMTSQLLYIYLYNPKTPAATWVCKVWMPLRRLEATNRNFTNDLWSPSKSTLHLKTHISCEQYLYIIEPKKHWHYNIILKLLIFSSSLLTHINITNDSKSSCSVLCFGWATFNHTATSP